MGDYHGNAQQNVREAARLNKDAQSSYHKSVGPVFDWCGEAIDNFNVILPHIKKEKVSDEDKDFIWMQTVTTINDGLIRTSKSLRKLNDVQVTSSRVKNLLATILHDTHEDFGSYGYYGRRKSDIQEDIDHYVKCVNELDFAKYIPIANIVGWILEYFNESRKKLRQAKDQKWDIENKFNKIIPKIKNATKVAETLVIPYLEEDITNLFVLRGNAGNVDNQNPLLKMESQTLRTSLAAPIQDLINQCSKYRAWHGKI
nr:uncharacterized protein LOC122321603 [Drosophila bipectinata]